MHVYSSMPKCTSSSTVRDLKLNFLTGRNFFLLQEKRSTSGSFCFNFFPCINYKRSPIVL